MPALRRLILVTAGVVLGGCSALAAWAGTRLPHTGAAYLYATAAILALGAVGVALGRLWGRAFALLSLATTALVFGAVAFEAARGGLSNTGSSDWAFLRGIVVAGVVAIALAGLAVSLGLCVGLVFAGRGEHAGLAVHALAWPLALAGVAAVAWIVGYHYAYRALSLARDRTSGIASAAVAVYVWASILRPTATAATRPRSSGREPGC